MAYSTFVIHVWTSTGETWHTVISRVMEKTAAYIVACLRHIFEENEALKAYKKHVMWMDGATNFKSTKFFGGVAYRMFEDYGWDFLRLAYGCPKHFKAHVDGYIGALNSAKANWVLSKRLSTPEEVVECYEDYFTKRRGIDGDLTVHRVYFLMPPEKKDLPMARFKAASTGPIRSGFCWTWRRSDQRRRLLRGRGMVLTALDMRWHGAADRPAAPENRCFPQLEPDDAPEEPGGEEAAAEDAPAIEPELLASTREFHGWRCSYSRVEDSHVIATRYAACLKRMDSALKDTLAPLEEAQRHRTAAEKKESHANREAKQACRAKARAKANASIRISALR